MLAHDGIVEFKRCHWTNSTFKPEQYIELFAYMVDDIETRFAKLSKRHRDNRFYGPLGALLLLVAMMALIPFITVVDEWQTRSFELVIYSSIIVAAAIPTGIFMKISSKAMIKNSEDINKAIAYDAYKSLDGIEYDDEKTRDKSKKKLYSLNYVIHSWAGTKMPSELARPIKELANIIIEKSVPIVRKGNEEQVAKVKQTIRDLMTALDAHITWDSLKVLIDEFRKLPTVVVEPEPKKPNLFMRHTFVPSIMISIPVGLGVYFGAVYLQAPPYWAFGYGVGSTIGTAAFVDRQFKKQ